MSSSSRKGFTLLELIVVIVILGILAAIAIPTFSSVIQKSREATLSETVTAFSREVLAQNFRGDGLVSSTDLSSTIADAPSGVSVDTSGAPSTSPSVYSAAASGTHVALAALSSPGRCVVVLASPGAAPRATTIPTTSDAPCTAGSALAYLGTNLLSNPGFEATSPMPIGYWNTPLARVTSPVHSGSYALSATASSASLPQGAVIASTTVPSGTQLAASFWILGPAGNQLLVGGRADGLAEDLGSHMVTLTGSWQQVTVFFTYSGQSFTPGVQFRTTAGQTGVTYYADDFTLTIS